MNTVVKAQYQLWNDRVTIIADTIGEDTEVSVQELRELQEQELHAIKMREGYGVLSFALTLYGRQ